MYSQTLTRLFFRDTVQGDRRGDGGRGHGCESTTTKKRDCESTTTKRHDCETTTTKKHDCECTTTTKKPDCTTTKKPECTTKMPWDDDKKECYWKCFKVCPKKPDNTSTTTKKHTTTTKKHSTTTKHCPRQ
jgi:hypothetical protein